MTTFNRLTLMATASAIGLALCLASGTAQTRAQRGVRVRISRTVAPAIDRGIRDNDPPVDVRTALTDPIGRSRANRLPYLPGSLIVKFRNGTSRRARTSMVGLVNGTGSTGVSYADFEIVSIAAEADPEAVARRLSAQVDVEYAQPRYRVHPMLVPNDPLYPRQWNYPAIGMERAWDINPGAGPSIVVAVLDTGLAYESDVLRFSSQAVQIDGQSFPSLGTVDVPFAVAPDLAGADRFVAPRDFIWNDDTALDMDGHGTHVAGTIGALTNNALGGAGMASKVRLMPVKVISTFWDDYFGSPFFGSDDVVARGIRYAADNGAKILNLSIGRSGPPAPAMRDAIMYAVSHGAFVVVAGGNNFLDGNPIERPADIAPEIEGLVSVAAIGRSLTRASYSSTGAYIELAAPGGDQTRDGVTGGILQQTYDLGLVDSFLDGPGGLRAPRFDAFAHYFVSGTSMATPHVSGFAALLMQQGITTPAAIEAAMKRYARDLGAPGRDNEYGYGLIDPRAALRGMGLAR